MLDISWPRIDQSYQKQTNKSKVIRYGALSKFVQLIKSGLFFLGGDGILACTFFLYSPVLIAVSVVLAYNPPPPPCPHFVVIGEEWANILPMLDH
jgi:hypothetical protein